MTEQMSFPFSGSAQAAAPLDHQVAHALVPLPSGTPERAGSLAVAPTTVAKAIEEVPEGTEGANDSATVGETLDAYRIYLTSEGMSRHTVESFSGDIKGLADIFPHKPLTDFTTQDLRDFMAAHARRGESQKTLYRKSSSIKNFFRWLVADGTLSEDPAKGLAFARAVPPLPELMTKDETEMFIEASRQFGSFGQLLVMLVLGAGLKRSDLADLTRDAIDVSDRLRPVVRINSDNRYKERDVTLPLDFVLVYEQYLLEHKPEGRLFDCTERHMNKVLQSIARRAGISHKRVSCQKLRDLFALQRLRAGDEMDDVLKKLGLAPTTSNEEAKQKYKQLMKLYGA